jgi:hypothetical protein
MKVFEIFNEDKHLIDRVSIVKGGAEETGYSLQRKKRCTVILANEEKKSHLPVAMRPNKMIFRSCKCSM